MADKRKRPPWDIPEIDDWNWDEEEAMRAGERQCVPFFGLGIGLGFILGSCRPRFACRPRYWWYGCRPYFWGGYSCRPYYWGYGCLPF